MQRKRIHIEGIVQGVGFRPFVLQTAERLGVCGWVLNDSRGVLIEAAGEAKALEGFLHILRDEAPPLSSISSFSVEEIAPVGDAGFVIRPSEGESEKKAQISPDTWVCPDCLGELFDPSDRRYRYPFINCTNCGPRYTIVTAVPYDRPHTTMAPFAMCSDCGAEYNDPASRRFHAQPIACPACGPKLALHDGSGPLLAGADPLAEAVSLLRQGKIGAIKGLGGYHLAVDAANDEAVRELRRRKARDEKPFALMVPSLAGLAPLVVADDLEQRLLAGVERPIVLLRKKPESALSPQVAPNNRYFGVMLPYTPLHYLLMEHFGALVMTSGNLSDEPIAFEDKEARNRLSGIADFHLGHDRDIHTRTDDSIARVMAGKALLLRRSRGYVPRGVLLPESQPTVLAVGAELKNTVCLTQDDRAFLSQHIGDLKNSEVCASFEKTIDHLKGIFGLNPTIVAHDLHPDSHGTRYAESLSGVTRVAVQHHHAHLASCMAENGAHGEVIGVIFDGLGYGADGHIWGGEFLVGGYSRYRRAGHFAYIPMPGGDAATREPFRMALSFLIRAFGEELPPLPLVTALPEKELRLYRKMIERGINAPLTSSCGRLFDAVAALSGLRQRVSYEGQAALELEMAIGEEREEGSYPFALGEEAGMLIFDPAPLIRALVGELLQGEAVSRVSARFHNTLARMVLEVCLRLQKETGLDRVALSGGVFQNRYLTERVLSLLSGAGFGVLTHSLVPPNDGGLALGQAVVAGSSTG